VGIPLTDSAPAGILTLSEAAIPEGYSLGEKGEVNNFSGKNIYTKAFYSNSSQEIIRLMYYLQPSECIEFNSKDYAQAICKAGKCVTSTSSSIVSDGKINFRSKNVNYTIDDGGSCARLQFLASNEKNSLTQEQIMKVIDSLERVPGEREVSSETGGNKLLSHHRPRRVRL
ncbi:MAG: hypothetical protein WBO92_00500, partial [Candidatus Moraniibacteriota bacterium]